MEWTWKRTCIVDFWWLQNAPICCLLPLHPTYIRTCQTVSNTCQSNIVFFLFRRFRLLKWCAFLSWLGPAVSVSHYWSAIQNRTTSIDYTVTSTLFLCIFFFYTLRSYLLNLDLKNYHFNNSGYIDHIFWRTFSKVKKNQISLCIITDTRHNHYLKPSTGWHEFLPPHVRIK